jgi:hypothetical protein
MTAPDLSHRQRELMETFVAAWEASSHMPFDLGHVPFEHPNWPPGVAAPNREEVRSLTHLSLLEVDRSVTPMWRVFPSAEGRRMFGGAADVSAASALADPDRRLGMILDGTVTAFETNPSEPLHFAPMQQIDLVQHTHWPLQPDVVRAHDLQQLQDLGLIATSSRGRDTAFWPTIDGRAAVKDAAGYLDRLAQQTSDEREKSRLRRWAERLRAGDVAVATVAGSTSAVIRALMGL